MNAPRPATAAPRTTAARTTAARTTQRGTTASRAVAALVLAVPFLTGFAGCGTEVFAACDKLEPVDKNGKTPGSLPATVIFIDLADNGPNAIDGMVRSVRPVVEERLTEGGYLRVVVSGGDGKPLRVSPCMDGRLFLFGYNNAGRRAQELAEAVDLLSGKLTDLLGTVEVAPTGTATRLFQSIPGETGRIRPQRGVEISETTAVLAGSLLGKSSKGDCLSLDGVTATPERARALVDRCFTAGQLTPLDVPLVLVGVGEGAVSTEQTFMANLLAGALCSRLRTCKETS